MRLSQHFDLLEFTRSKTAEELNIPNNPTGMQIDNLTALCSCILEPLRIHFGKPITIISGFRSKELNISLDPPGSINSQHMKGEAADIEIVGVRNDEIWKYISENLPFDQVIAEKLKMKDGSAGWIHVSHAGFGKQRGEKLSFLGHGKYVPGLQYVS